MSLYKIYLYQEQSLFVQLYGEDWVALLSVVNLYYLPRENEW